MRSAVFLSVRNKAARLPGKTFLDLAGKPVVERIVERLELCREAEVLLIATSTHPSDDTIEEFGRAREVLVFRGSEDDKLIRYLEAARRHAVDLMAIVDGDDPFCDPGYIDRLLRTIRDEALDYARIDGLPVGVGANGIRTSALERVCALKDNDSTEVWAGYFTDSGRFRTRLIPADPVHSAPDWRMTLDYPEDYEFFKAVFAGLGGDAVFSLDRIMAFLKEHPDILEINHEAGSKYEANLQRITRVRFKDEIVR